MLRILHKLYLNLKSKASAPNFNSILLLNNIFSQFIWFTVFLFNFDYSYYQQKNFRVFLIYHEIQRK